MRVNIAEPKLLLARIFIFSSLAAFLFAVVFTLSFKEAVGSDLVSYLTGARILRQERGEFLYNLDKQYYYQQKVIKPHVETGLLPFVNPPIIALFFIPLSFFPLLYAYKIYIIILFLVMVFISGVVSKIFSNLRESFWLILPFIFYPSFGAVFVGQLSPFLVLCFLLIYLYLTKTNESIVGILAGLLLLKVQYIILVPYLFLLVKDKRLFIKYFLSSMLILVTISSLLSGWKIWDNYFITIYFAQNPEYGTRVWNMFTLHSSLSQIKPFSSLSYIELALINLLFYLISLGIFIKLSRFIPLDRLFAIAVILTLVFCMHGVNYDLSLLLLPIFILLNTLRKKAKKNMTTYITVLLTILILVVSPVLYPLKISFWISFIFIIVVIMLVLIDVDKFKFKLSRSFL